MEALPVLDSQFQEEDHIDLSIRPKSLDDFVGQDDLCANLKVFITAARQRKEALDHVLFYGPPGLGKTTLAQIIASELGVGFRATSGPLITKAGDLAAVLTNLNPHDVLFIDEIHRLSPAIEEVLYPAMEDCKLDLIVGEGPGARSIQIDLPPFTLVAATTRTGMITSPLRDRFGIPMRLNFYSVGELQQIVQRAAGLMALQIDSKATQALACRSRGTPRISGRLLRRVRDFAAVENHAVISEALTISALKRLGVDDQGFDQQDRKYLESIAVIYQGGPVGVETLASILSEQKDTVEDVIEPYLIQQGFIQKTPRGRMLTQLAYDYLGMEPVQK